MSRTRRFQFSLLHAIIAMFVAAVVLYLNVRHFDTAGALVDVFVADALTLWVYCGFVDAHSPSRLPPEKSRKVP